MDTTGKLRQIQVTENNFFIEVEPLSFLQSTHIYILLAALVTLKCPVNNAFATNVSYSVGHLTSILEYDPRTPATTVVNGEPKAGIEE
jgi:hypothetical protein